MGSEMCIRDSAITPLTFANRNPDVHAVKKGAVVRFVLWSMQPNDLDNVRFVLKHWTLAPRSDDAFVAWIHEKQARQAERWTRQQPRRAKRSQRRAKRSQRRAKRQAAKPPRPVRTTPTVQPSAVAVAVTPAPIDPGPPPSPVPETSGAAPFAGAVWTPGYWHWHEPQWIWISGWWSGQPPRVPTILPPAPKSTVRIEHRTKPEQPAVFIRGHWSVGINGVRWIEGRWHLRVGVE